MNKVLEVFYTLRRSAMDTRDLCHMLDFIFKSNKKINLKKNQLIFCTRNYKFFLPDSAVISKLI